MYDDVKGIFFYSALGILHAVVLPETVPHPQTLCQVKQILRAGGEIIGVHPRVKLWQLLASTVGQEKQRISSKATLWLLVL